MSAVWLEKATSMVMQCYGLITQDNKNAVKEMCNLLAKCEDIGLGEEAPAGFSSAYTLLVNEAQQVLLGWEQILGDKFEYAKQDLGVMDRACLQVRLELECNNHDV
jgi:hypothetical protein